MLDKNGVEIKTGCIVRITGAFSEKANGLYFVQAAPGDPSWCGSDYCLKRISESGAISKEEDSTCFWPTAISIRDKEKAEEVGKWNKEHAETEVKEIKNMAEVVAYFKEQASQAEGRARWTEHYFGENHPEVEQNRTMKAYYEAVIASLEQPTQQESDGIPED
jgi:hypothetical protein